MTDRTATATERFTEAYSVMYGAAIGVTLIRTKEPFRAMDAIHDFAIVKGKNFSSWSNTVGWSDFVAGVNPENVAPDRQTQPVPALFSINGVAGDNAKEKGIFAMVWPHETIKAPPVQMCLAEYTRNFPGLQKWLCLIVPHGYTLPAELESMIPILDFDVPDREELAESLSMMIEDIPEEYRFTLASEDVSRAVSAGQGMTMAEWESALARSFVRLRNTLPNIPVDDLVQQLMDLKVEIVKRSEMLELMPAVSMSEVGGLQPLKNWIAKRAFAFTDEARSAGVDKPKGIALIGSPGSGKSLVGKAVASTLGMPLIRFDVSRCFHGIVGSSEERTRNALKMIDDLSPCVVHLDEVDKVFDMNSGGGDSGVGKRVLGTILTHLQESKYENFWVLTANRVDGLPSELLRKGRLDEVWSVGLPNEREREEIFGIHITKRGYKVEEVDDLQACVDASAGFTAAEIEGAVKEASLENFAEWRESGGEGELPSLTSDRIVAAFAGMKPMSEAFEEQFRAMEQWAANNARAAGGDGSMPVRRRKARGARRRQIDVGDSMSLDG